MTLSFSILIEVMSFQKISLSMLKYKILFVLFFGFGVISAQQLEINESPSDSSQCLLKSVLENDANLFINDISEEVSKPTNFYCKDWIKIGAVAGLTGIFMTQDQFITDFTDKNHNSTTNKIVKVGELYGSSYSVLIIPAGFYLSGLILQNDEIKSTGRILVESLLFSGIIAQAIKISFGRARPYMNEGTHFFKPFNLKSDYNSFPSGHTVVAFTISSVLSQRFDNIFASIGLYTLASLTAYQRIYSNNHWFSDTFLSAAIGIVIGNSMVEIQNKDKGKESQQTFSIIPIVNYNFAGAYFTYRF